MKYSRKLLLCIACCTVVWLVFCIVAGCVAAEWAVHPLRRAVTQDDQLRAISIAQSGHAVLQSVSIAAGGVVLRAWYIRPVQGNGDAVILLHGQADNRTGMLGAADMLLRHGYSVLLPDARAQGLSDGNIATYGYLESVDIRGWVDWLKQNQKPHCIDGLGESMGAAQLLNSLAVEHRFCAVAAESSFASFREASYVRIGEWFHTGPWLGRTLLGPVVESGILYARCKYHVDLAKVDPARAAAASLVPVLLIHGLADTNMPPYNAEMIAARSKGHNPEASLWQPPHAGHCGAMEAEPREFENRVVGWFQSHQNPAGR